MDRRTFLGSIGAAAVTLQLAGPGTAVAKTTALVTSISQLQSAINSATAGTTITLANGTYAVSSAITVSGRNGTSSAPITIQAETRGGVTLTGSKSFVMSNSSYVTVSGFVFQQTSSFDLPSSCTRIRITRNDFQLGSAASHSLVVRGDDVKVDRNVFHDKSTAGCYLVIDGPSSTVMAKRTHILRNHFRDHSFGGDNGGEPIRLGDSGRALSSAGATVEYNLFERANGDPEAISVKSSGNTVRYNTLRSSTGGIVLRHGNNNRVEGNHLLAGGNGIRIYGNDHLIVNNYVDGVDDAGIVLGSGSVRDHFDGESSTSRKGNDAPDRVTIVLNTLRDNGKGLVGESQRALAPLACRISDNLLVGSSGDLVDMPYLGGITWSGNILWGSASNGNIPSGGFTRADPKLSAGTDGVYRLGSGSAAINATSMNHSSRVTDDVDGQPRTAPYDVGADEYSTATLVRRPLTAADVGPNAT
ncbi:polysaccharide lyase 6 family protein [Kribbella sp. CA-293567]|uniref:polysaccharide lyase 6 family protein n=1 Tax=Kribbella sp. CA-293567 TaxID=3002436 RepID=UPI0022DE02CC|nr:polysaccharide lyase 6 family protein [Kribbella sp. CA-293567]WBQ01905.1 polysaccharide lyase 6 family protein [Kribbella sp. CA-293567]